jgi:hypothetical protein
MPYDDPDPTDPMTLTGVELLVEGPAAVREMAACFVEEYLRLGHSPEALDELFASGEFAGPALALRRLGREAIRELIEEHVALRGPRGSRLAIERVPTGALSLPVLER